MKQELTQFYIARPDNKNTTKEWSLKPFLSQYGFCLSKFLNTDQYWYLLGYLIFRAKTLVPFDIRDFSILFYFIILSLLRDYLFAPILLVSRCLLVQEFGKRYHRSLAKCTAPTVAETASYYWASVIASSLLYITRIIHWCCPESANRV